MKNQTKRILSVLLAVMICSTFSITVDAKTAKKYVKSIKVKSKATITIPADKKAVTKTYTVKVKVKGKASKKFTAKSSKTSVAAVKVSGKKIKVTAKKSGIAKITVKTKGKNKKGKKLSKKLTITVKKNSQPLSPDETKEKEGTITKKDVPWYAFAGGQIVESKNPVYFSSKYPDVPFVTDNYAIEFFLENMGYTSKGKEVKSANGLSHNYDLPMGTSVTFDYDSKMMIFSDYTSMLVPNGDYMLFNPFAVAAPKTDAIYKVTEDDMYHGGDPIAVTFAYDEVPMLKNGNDILIPLQAYTDFFMSYFGQFFNYNGKGVFLVDNSLAKDNSRQVFYDKYWKDAVKTDKISPALAQVNYYELCNALEARYGLQAAHNIATFDEYFNRMGVKEKMLSEDLETIEKTQQDISTMLFEDFHSSAGMQSVFLKEPIEYEPKESPVFKSRIIKSERIYSTRKDKLGKVPGEDFPAYQVIGDTAFITFDSFGIDPNMNNYKAEGYTPEANPNDTVELFAYALRQLEADKNGENKIKNVVIDLSCNGGGAVLGCGYALQAICGQCNVNIQNPVTLALHQIVLDYDLNFDGDYDNDKSMLDMDKNVAVLISDFSFSCGNLLPNALDQLDDRILLIGQQSGGGACAVGYLSTAVGSTMQISSEKRFSTMKNGYIRDIDGGIAPDIHLTLNQMFDRSFIDKKVSEQFDPVE